MPTKSMMKTVTIRTEQEGLSLIDALEKSVQQGEWAEEYKTKCSSVEKESIDIFFGIGKK